MGLFSGVTNTLGTLLGGINGGKQLTGSGSSSSGGLTGANYTQLSQVPAWQNSANQSIYGGGAAALGLTPDANGNLTYTGSTPPPAVLNNGYQDAVNTGLNAQGQYQPYFDSAVTDLNNATQSYGSTFSPTDVNAPQVTTNNFDQAAAQQYMNPYFTTALAPAAQQLQLQLNQQNQQLAGQEGAEGAFGGSRSALLQSGNAYNTDQSLANLYGTGAYNAFNSAGNLFESDQSRNLQGQEANQNAAINTGEFNQTQDLNAYNANRNQFNVESQADLQAASESGQLGVEKSNVTSQNMARQQAAGAIEQTQNYPTYALQTLSSLANPAAKPTVQNIGTPSTLGQIGSLATAATGLLGAGGNTGSSLSSLLGGSSGVQGGALSGSGAAGLPDLSLDSSGLDSLANVGEDSGLADIGADAAASGGFWSGLADAGTSLLAFL